MPERVSANGTALANRERESTAIPREQKARVGKLLWEQYLAEGGKPLRHGKKDR